MVGIQAYAVHVPRLSVARDAYAAAGRAGRVAQKRVADHDEDEVTLAIAAARKLLALGGPAPGALLVASDEGRGIAGLLTEALGLDGARVGEFSGPLAGLDALLAAQDAAAHGAVLVVTADAPRFGPGDEREAAAGSAATAWLVTMKGPLQFRRAAAGADVASALKALTRSGLAPDSAARFATRDADKGQIAACQATLAKAKAGTASQDVGDAGASAPLLALASCVETAQTGETLVVAAHGGSRGAALSLEFEAALTAATLRDALAAPWQALDFGQLARLRGWLSEPRPDVSQGAAISMAQWQESLPARLRFRGQRCMACAKPQFPPREACKACGHGKLDPLPMSGKGHVFSLTTIGRGSAPAEFAEQQRRAGAYDVIIVELAEGPRVAAMACDGQGRLRIGDSVDLVVRRLYTQEGQARYGFKARPAA